MTMDVTFEDAAYAPYSEARICEWPAISFANQSKAQASIASDQYLTEQWQMTEYMPACRKPSQPEMQPNNKSYSVFGLEFQLTTSHHNWQGLGDDNTM